MALDTFNPYLFVSSGEQSNKFLTPTYADGIAQFQAQRAQSLTGLTVRIDPIQEGTGDPSPTNIRPISGRTGMTVTRAGKNLGELVEGTKVSSQNSTVTYKEGGVSVFSTGSYGRSGYVIPVVKGQHYTVSFKCKRVGEPYAIQFNNVADFGYTYAVYGRSEMPTDSFSKKSFRFVANTDVLFVGVYPSDVDTCIYIEEFQIETGDTATAYEPYTAQTYPIAWETEAGTVYGGTLDVVSGVLTVDRGYCEFTGDEVAWIKSSTFPGSFYIGVAYIPSVIKDLQQGGDLICSHAKYIGRPTISNYVYGCCGLDTAVNLFLGTEEMTYEEFRQWLSDQKTAGTPVTISGRLATPQTYRLTGEDVRTIAGYNQIYSDAGPIIDIKF